MLLGSSVEMAGTASAGTIRPSMALRPEQVAALDSLVVHRLNMIRVSFGLVTGQTTTAYNDEVTKAVLSNEDPPFAPVTGAVIEEGSLWGIVPGATGSPASSALEIVNGWVGIPRWLGRLGASDVER
jgi:hypothetical protein